MVLIEGMMHRRVKWWIAGISILLITAFAAIAISAQAASYIVGGRILKYTRSCTAATGSAGTSVLGGLGGGIGNNIPSGGVIGDALTVGECASTVCLCARCGCVTAPCAPPPAKWSEIIIAPAGGGNPTYACPPANQAYLGASRVPTPRKNILGYGATAYGVFKLGLSR